MPTPMPLSWNETRRNAIRFAKDTRHYTSESSDKQTLWNDFFALFAPPRRRRQAQACAQQNRVSQTAVLPTNQRAGVRLRR